jgi:tetratricopeptide (TPR) repeat protein
MFGESDDEVFAARQWVQREHDNIRAALAWALPPGELAVLDRCEFGLQLCAAELAEFWGHGGYVTEGRRWLERAVSMSGGKDRTEVATCLRDLAWLSGYDGDTAALRRHATASVTMYRRVSAPHQELSIALSLQARGELYCDDMQAARRTYSEAIALAEPGTEALGVALRDLGDLETEAANHDRALERYEEAIQAFADAKSERGVHEAAYGKALALMRMDRFREAEVQMSDHIPPLLRLSANWGSWCAESYAEVLTGLGCSPAAASLLGAADAMRARDNNPRDLEEEEDLQRWLGKARTAVAPDLWANEYQRGLAMSVTEALAQAWMRPEPGH